MRSVVMPNHVHVLCSLHQGPNALSDILRSWKNILRAKEIKRRSHGSIREKVWQDENYDRIVRDEKSW